MLTKRWTQLRYHPEQVRLWESTTRFRIVAAGRGSGKTELAKRQLVMALATPVEGCERPQYFVAAPTRAQVKRIYWQDLLDLTPQDWISDISRVDMTIFTIFGSMLHVVGLDQPARIEGSQYVGGVVDECSDIKPGAWSRSIRPALSQFQGWCIRQGVPKRFGIGAAEFRESFETAQDHDDTDAFKWLSADILLPEEIEAAKQDLGLEDYMEQYCAEWPDEGGSLFYAFSSTETCKPCRYDPSKQIFVSCDFNVTPMAWILAHWIEGKLYVFDEIRLNNSNTQKALNCVWSRYDDHTAGWVFTGDATSKARKTSASETDYVQIFNDTRFRGAGRRVHIGDSNPRVADRIAETNRLLCDAAGRRRLYVDPACRYLIDELRLRNEKTPDLSHATDALGYLCHFLAPLKPDLQSTEPSPVIIRRFK